MRTKIATLKDAISEQNLELVPEYEQRIQVLKELNFIDDKQTVQLKGRVACEVGFHCLGAICDIYRHITDQLG